MNSSTSRQIAQQLPILESITKLFHPYVEVVLHDLESGTIAAIYNDLSRRRVGERSHIAKFVGDHAEAFPDIFEPYYKTNWDGRKFKCVSTTIRNDKGKPIVVVCINFDASVFEGANKHLEQLLSVAKEEPQNPIEQFTEDWRARINECITNYLKENYISLDALSKTQKRQAVHRLYEHGLFSYRNAATYIGEQLRISRATVYNYLKEEE